MKIKIRVDASLQIGSGHVMRCLTLARALRERGAHCHFICRVHQGHLLQKIRQAGFEAIALPLSDKSNSSLLSEAKSALAHAYWLGSDWMTDASQTIAAIGGAYPDWIIVDHYGLDHRWESQLRPACRKILAIDDLADRKHDCDLLLDQNLVAGYENRYDSLVPTYCTRLLGPRYALLQPQYAELHPRALPRLGPIQRILAYFGGADKQNLTGRAIAAFLALDRKGLFLDVVINSDSPHAISLRNQVKHHDNVVIHEDLPSLAPLMIEADLAIGAAGATSWERCCLGLPTLVVSLAENQTLIAAELDRLKLVYWLGNQETVSVSALKLALQKAFKIEGSLVQWSSHCRALVDGRGAGQVAELLLLSSTSNLTARLAYAADENQLFSWANDSLVRKNAFSPEPIEPATHSTWFHKRLCDPENCQIYIVETKAGIPIGQVRFERSEEAWEIDYSLVAAARGRGLGAHLLNAAIQTFRQSRNGILVFGRVKPGNLASEKVFRRLGFKVANSGGASVYRRALE